MKRVKSALDLKHAPVRLPAEAPILITRHSPADAPFAWMHAHDCFEIGYCRSGAGIFLVEGKLLPFTAGDAIFIGCREMHVARSTGLAPSDWTFIYLDPPALVNAPPSEASLFKACDYGGSGFKNTVSPAECPGLCALVRELVEELDGAARFRLDAARGLAWAILARLRALRGEAFAGSGSAPAGALRKVAPALERIGGRLAEDVSVGELARLCHLSEPHFRRLFRQAVGCGPKQFQIRARVKLASALLASGGKQIIEVSALVGYSCLSTFNRHFREVLGKAPRDWRGKG